MIDAYKAALDAVEQTIANVKPEQFTKATPCTEFDVKALTNHIVGGAYMMSMVAAGESVERGRAVPDMVGNDPLGAFKTAKEAAIAAVSDPSFMSKTLKFPFGEMPAPQGMGVMLMETWVHRWDLATATGQDATIPPQVAEMILAGAKQSVASELRTPEAKVFGQEITVPDSASPTEKLVAFLGRKA